MPQTTNAFDSLMPVRIVYDTEPVVKRLGEVLGASRIITVDDCLILPLANFNQLRRVESGDPEAVRIINTLARSGHTTPSTMHFGDSYVGYRREARVARINLIPEAEGCRDYRDQTDIINRYLERREHRRIITEPVVSAAYELTAEEARTVCAITQVLLGEAAMLSEPLARVVELNSTTRPDIAA